jgi:transposase
VSHWRQAAQDANAKPVLTMAEQKELEKRRAQDQREIKALKKELQRKEKAMAEMAALLVLRKQWEAYSFGEAFGYSSEDAEG